MSLKLKVEAAAVLGLIIALSSQVQPQSGRLRGQSKPPQHHDEKETIRLRAEEVLPKVVGRKSVVVVTDGIDSFDELDFEAVLTKLHRSRATVYVVSQNEMLLRELKPRAFNPLSWYEMIDPAARKRIEKLRA